MTVADDSWQHEPSVDDDRVQALRARLAELDDRPTAEHAEIYDELHRRLHDALADPDGS